MARLTIGLTESARRELRADEVVLIDWQITGMCCADAGEFDVRPIRRSRLPAGMRAVSEHIAVHPMAWAQLAEISAGSEDADEHRTTDPANPVVTVDCKRILRFLPRIGSGGTRHGGPRRISTAGSAGIRPGGGSGFGGIRLFTTDLPSDAGLRACFGRLHAGRQV